MSNELFKMSTSRYMDKMRGYWNKIYWRMPRSGIGCYHSNHVVIILLLGNKKLMRKRINS